jgi:probable F420-dependent oxidoreductase
MPVKFAFPLKQRGIDAAEYPALAAAAESHGFESVWLPEHLVLPKALPPTYPYSASGNAPITPQTPEFDPWVALAAVAGATSTIRLATGVFILPLRHPIATARSVMTLDRVSRGRAVLGIGVGWMEEEFVAVGQSFADRGDRTDESIDLIRRLWSEDVVEHHGRHFDFGPVCFEPKPVQQPVPIEVGGTSPAALRRAGRLGDGWIELGSTDLDEITRRLAVIEEARARAGRSGPFEVTCSVPTCDRELVDRYEAAGVTRLLTGPPPSTAGHSVADVLGWIGQFAGEVIGRP